MRRPEPRLCPLVYSDSGQTSTAVGWWGAGMKNVLVVDDDASIRELIVAALDLDGIPCREAADGRAALALLAQQRPAVVLLDMDMPAMDGPSFRTALDHGGGRDDIAIVVMTASDRAARFREVCVADDTLGKP